MGPRKEISFIFAQIDHELAEAIVRNTRRYVSLFSDVIAELLPVYKQKEASCVIFDPLTSDLSAGDCQGCPGRVHRAPTFAAAASPWRWDAEGSQKHVP